MMNGSSRDIIISLATKSNAKGYQEASEKYLFCVDLLTEKNLQGTESQVNLLEDLFDIVLQEGE